MTLDYSENSDNGNGKTTRLAVLETKVDYLQSEYGEVKNLMKSISGNQEKLLVSTASLTTSIKSIDNKVDLLEDKLTSRIDIINDTIGLKINSNNDRIEKNEKDIEEQAALCTNHLIEDAGSYTRSKILFSILAAIGGALLTGFIAYLTGIVV